MRQYADCLKTIVNPSVLLITQALAQGAHLIIASNEKSVDAKHIMQHLAKKYGGGGGGRQEFSQGKINAFSSIDALKKECFSLYNPDALNE